MNSQDLNYILKRAVAEIIVEEEMVKLLQSGKKLRLKEGFDPSAPDLHLGYMIALRKLRQFQELGHQIVLIIADWTARIGDPSGVSVTRPMLTEEQVKANAETYTKQFFKIVDKEKTEIRWQSEWFGKFDLGDVIRLASKFTVAQFLARDDFNRRYSEGRPIAITELLYPLLQAYDSVAIEADVEFGGTDQKFNFLVGRELQSMMGQKPQQCFMMPMLVGPDGGQKMSQSLGNYIGIDEPPEDIYGKTMSIRDEFILTYFELLTDVPDEELAEFRKQLDDESINPMMLKKRLAIDIVSQLFSKKEADKAEKHFERVHQDRKEPEEIKECLLSISAITPQHGQYHDGGADVSRLLIQTGQAKSRSEANRFIAQGSVTIDGTLVNSHIHTVQSGSIIKVGKRRFVKVINTD